MGEPAPEAGAISQGVAGYVRQLVLESVPARRADGLTATVLAFRADMNPEHMGAQLRRLEAGGQIHSHTVAGVRRYFRTEEAMPEEPATIGAPEILAALPGDPFEDGEAMTAKEVAAHLQADPQQVYPALSYLLKQDKVRRLGEGGPRSPFRYFRAPDGEPAETEAADRGLTAEREATNTQASPDSAPRGRSPMAAVADAFDPPGTTEHFGAEPVILVDGEPVVPLADAAVPGGPFLARHPATRAAAFDVVAKDLEARAIEARREAEILTAAAKLVVRIREELAAKVPA